MILKPHNWFCVLINLKYAILLDQWPIRTRLVSLYYNSTVIVLWTHTVLWTGGSLKIVHSLPKCSLFQALSSWRHVKKRGHVKEETRKVKARKRWKAACKNIFNNPLLPDFGLMRSVETWSDCMFSLKWGWGSQMTSTVCDICAVVILFSIYQPYFASLLFMTGMLCCVFTRNFKQSWAVINRMSYIAILRRSYM